MSALQRIGADSVGTKWRGTYIAPDGRVAVVTERASSRERALSAAAAWVADAEATRGDGTYGWYASVRHAGRFEVFRETRLGAVPVPLQRA
jgi:hypothetical protein